MDTAIVILNYNGISWLKKFLPTVIKYSKDEADVYVIDNGSSDDSVDYLKKEHPSIKLITLDNNLGFAGGYNKGLQQIEHPYYVLLNSDIEVTKNWITPIINTFKEQPEITAIQPKILSFQNKKQFEYAGAAGGLMDKLKYPFCRGRVLIIQKLTISNLKKRLRSFGLLEHAYLLGLKIFMKIMVSIQISLLIWKK